MVVTKNISIKQCNSLNFTEYLLSLKHGKHIRSEIADETFLTKKWGYTAALALLPYAILKSLWAWD